MKKALSYVVVLLLVGCGGGGGGSSPPAPLAPPAPPPPPSAAVEAFRTSVTGLDLADFYDESYKLLLQRSPQDIVSLALGPEFDIAGVLLNDESESYRRDTFAMFGIALDALAGFDQGALSEREQIDYDVYEWYLQSSVDRLPYYYHDFRATYFGFSVQRSTERFFTDIHPLLNTSDAEDYIERLRRLERKFTDLRLHLFAQRDAGIVEPRLSMQVAIDQIDNLVAAGVDGNPYFTAFRDKVSAIPGIDAGERDRLIADARGIVESNVILAYRQLRSTLNSLLAGAPPRVGVGQYPQGESYYTYALRFHTTTDLTAAEIHQLGLDELDRIHAEMRELFDQLGYPQNETLTQLYARVASDGGTVPAANSLQTFEDLVAFAEANLSQAFDVLPSQAVVVLPDPFGGFYIGPSFDGSRPGAFYAGTDFDQPYFQMPSLTYHESVPGHHMQIGIAADQDVPVFRKIVRNTGYVEGWALYAERLAYELGWYDNDIYGNLGRLQYEALRAARLVMDTGIHDLGWTFERAARVNQDATGLSISSSQGAAARYSVWPGQATAYMVGYLQILAERARAEAALGPAYSLQGFHRAVLTNGAVPLAVLPKVVDQYITSASTP